jgi:molybdopterin molybdotransferase
MQRLADAQTEILRRAGPLAPGRLELSPAALGRVLAEPVVGDRDLPPFDKSMMDGYAVRAADCLAPGARLAVVGEVVAGATPERAVDAGQAVRIMTGAPLPPGADAVVMVEQTRVDGDRVFLDSAARPGQNVQPRGRECRAGEVVLPAGTVLRPAELALLATVGRTAVQAHRAPSVAVVTTGDEIVPAGVAPGPAQICNSNGPMLAALVVRAGGALRDLGVAPDRVDALTAAVRAGLDADVLILTGGVSAGKLDLVPGVLRELGVEPHVHKVRMKPGKPFYFGSRGGTLVFGLPGNPVSSFVCFELFVRPGLDRLGGVADPLPRAVRLPLAEPFSPVGDRPTYQPARIEPADVGERVRPVRWLGSADLRGLCGADALAVVEPGERELPAGTPIPVVRLVA